jgi:hypothetical protein
MVLREDTIFEISRLDQGGNHSQIIWWRMNEFVSAAIAAYLNLPAARDGVKNTPPLSRAADQHNRFQPLT